MMAINPTYVVLALVILVFIAFVKDKYSPDVVALFSVAVLLSLNIIDTTEFLSIFSNSAPLTIAFMFIISKALERTGCLQTVGHYISKLAGKSYLRALLVTMFLVMIVSAFMNNTPVVILMTPIVIALSRSVGVAPSKMLIPLSFAAIFGGTTTLIGTSTNILVGGVVAKQGLPAIGMFEMTIPALIFAAAGLIYITIASHFILPSRHSLSSILDSQPKRKFLAQIMITNGSKYIDKTIADIKEIGKKAKVIDVIRNDQSVNAKMENFKLQHADRIVIEANAGEVIGLKENGELDLTNSGSDISPISADEKIVMEGSLNQNSSLIGKRVGALNLNRKYGVYILAVHRDEDHTEDLNNVILKFGDTLLIEGNAEKIAKLLDEGNVVNLAEPQEKPLLKSKAPIAILTIIAVMVLSAFEVLPIVSLAMIGAVVVMITGCVDPEEAYNSIDWRILFLIFGMFGLSIGMEKTGAMELVVNKVVDFVGTRDPVIILGTVYVLASIFTEIVSNNAVVILLGPIAINLAEQLGFDSRPFIMAIMFAASASFATPIGYQTNTFVYGAGGYKFKDFLKIGVPLNIIFAIMATIILPIFFPFH